MTPGPSTRDRKPKKGMKCSIDVRFLESPIRRRPTATRAGQLEVWAASQRLVQNVFAQPSYPLAWLAADATVTRVEDDYRCA